jgi:hypothetical protein
VDDIAVHLCSAAEFHLIGSDLAVNASPDANRFCYDLPPYRGTLAYGQGAGVDVALHDSVDLDVTFGNKIADNA